MSSCHNKQKKLLLLANFATFLLHFTFILISRLRHFLQLPHLGQIIYGHIVFIHLPVWKRSQLCLIIQFGAIGDSFYVCRKRITRESNSQVSGERRGGGARDRCGPSDAISRPRPRGDQPHLMWLGVPPPTGRAAQTFACLTLYSEFDSQKTLNISRHGKNVDLSVFFSFLHPWARWVWQSYHIRVRDSLQMLTPSRR